VQNRPYLCRRMWTAQHDIDNCCKT
jgi:hypothetical protein